MERNEQSLSTREFASPDDPSPRETTISTNEGADGLNSEQTQAEARDRPARSDIGESDLAPSVTEDDADSSTEQPLLTADTGASFQRRWEEIQTRFVDEPRGAVQDADALVANVMQQLAEGFAQERERLEAHWDRGEDISTEDLRVALQRYRSFFRRLLTT